MKNPTKPKTIQISLQKCFQRLNREAIDAAQKASPQVKLRNLAFDDKDQFIGKGDFLIYATAAKSEESKLPDSHSIPTKSAFYTSLKTYITYFAGPVPANSFTGNDMYPITDADGSTIDNKKSDPPEKKSSDTDQTDGASSPEQPSTSEQTTKVDECYTTESCLLDFLFEADAKPVTNPVDDVQKDMGIDSEGNPIDDGSTEKTANKDDKNSKLNGKLKSRLAKKNRHEKKSGQDVDKNVIGYAVPYQISLGSVEKARAMTQKNIKPRSTFFDKTLADLKNFKLKTFSGEIFHLGKVFDPDAWKNFFGKPDIDISTIESKISQIIMQDFKGSSPSVHVMNSSGVKKYLAQQGKLTLDSIETQAKTAENGPLTKALAKTKEFLGLVNSRLGNTQYSITIYIGKTDLYYDEFDRKIIANEATKAFGRAGKLLDRNKLSEDDVIFVNDYLPKFKPLNIYTKPRQVVDINHDHSHDYEPSDNSRPAPKPKAKTKEKTVAEQIDDMLIIDDLMMLLFEAKKKPGRPIKLQPDEIPAMKADAIDVPSEYVTNKKDSDNDEQDDDTEPSIVSKLGDQVRADAKSRSEQGSSDKTPAEEPADKSKDLSDDSKAADKSDGDKPSDSTDKPDSEKSDAKPDSKTSDAEKTPAADGEKTDKDEKKPEQANLSEENKIDFCLQGYYDQLVHKAAKPNQYQLLNRGLIKFVPTQDARNFCIAHGCGTPEFFDQITTDHVLICWQKRPNTRELTMSDGTVFKEGQLDGSIGQSAITDESIKKIFEFAVGKEVPDIKKIHLDGKNAPTDIAGETSSNDIFTQKSGAKHRFLGYDALRKKYSKKFEGKPECNYYPAVTDVYIAPFNLNDTGVVPPPPPDPIPVDPEPTPTPPDDNVPERPTDSNRGKFFVIPLKNLKYKHDRAPTMDYGDGNQYNIKGNDADYIR